MVYHGTMQTLLKKIFAGFSNGAMAYEGWMHVSSIEEANDKITAFETATTSRFCCVQADKDFGRTGNIFFLNFHG